MFGASEGLKGADLKVVRDKAIPGADGILDLSRYLDEGYGLIAF